MKLTSRDVYFAILCMAIFLPFIISDSLQDAYNTFNRQNGVSMSFFKFAILATLGEVIGLRIKTGKYSYEGFGILPRALVWGLLGITIQMAFVIFSTGAPVFLEFAGFRNATEHFIVPNITLYKVFIAFFISITMNLIYAPIMMTLHKITDTHIEDNGGTLPGLFKPIKISNILSEINWHVQWHFVFKKTIPLFWIPAHTITFLLPSDYRVLFAAMLSIVLGVFLAIAAVKNRA